MAIAIARCVLLVLSMAMLPIVTAWLVHGLTVGWRTALDPEERARRLMGFRGAAVWVEGAVLLLASILGHVVIGPELVGSPHSPLSMVATVVCAATAFVSGGIARVVEMEGAGWRERRDAAMVRVRLLPMLAAPAVVAIPARALPLVDTSGAEPRIVAWALALRVLLLGFSVAFAAVVAMRISRAIVPAPDEVREMAHYLARKEGIGTPWVLWFPTGTARFANAVALPWARTLVVTERLRDVTTADGLRAIIAHEVGHLSEPPWAWLTRLAVATLGAFVWAEGIRLGHAFGWGVGTLVGVAFGMYVVKQVYMRLSRRLELRADERARALTSPEAAAAGLEALRVELQVPLSTATTTHPTFHQRLTACGVTLPPPVIARSAGGLLGPVVAVDLAGAAYQGVAATSLEGQASPTASAATLRTLIAPWDPSGHRALEAIARRTGELDRAESHRRDAERAEAAESAAAGGPELTSASEPRPS